RQGRRHRQAASSDGLVVRRFEVGRDEKNAQQEIDGCERQVGWVRATLENEHDDSDAKAEFLEDGWKHQRAIAYRVGGNDPKGKLPGKRDADESIIKAGMCDRWRVLAANFVEDKIERRKDKHAIDGGNPKNDLRKLQASLRRAFNTILQGECAGMQT